MKPIALAGILLLSGCAKHHAMLSTSVAPGQSPSRADPIYLMAMDKPSIAEQKAVIMLRAELCRNGFTVVDNPRRARWHMGFGSETSTDAADKGYRLSFGRALLFGPVSGIGAGDPVSRTRATLALYQVKADGLLAPVWEGEARVTEKQARAFGGDVYRTLLDKLGRDFHGPSRLGYADPDDEAMKRCRDIGP